MELLLHLIVIILGIFGVVFWFLILLGIYLLWSFFKQFDEKK